MIRTRRGLRLTEAIRFAITASKICPRKGSAINDRNVVGQLVLDHVSRHDLDLLAAQSLARPGDCLSRHLRELGHHVDPDHPSEVVARGGFHEHGAHPAANVDEDVIARDLAPAQNASHHAPR